MNLHQNVLKISFFSLISQHIFKICLLQKYWISTMRILSCKLPPRSRNKTQPSVLEVPSPPHLQREQPSWRTATGICFTSVCIYVYVCCCGCWGFLLYKGILLCLLLWSKLYMWDSSMLHIHDCSSSFIFTVIQ